MIVLSPTYTVSSKMTLDRIDALADHLHVRVDQARNESAGLRVADRRLRSAPDITSSPDRVRNGRSPGRSVAPSRRRSVTN